MEFPLQFTKDANIFVVAFLFMGNTILILL